MSDSRRQSVSFSVDKKLRVTSWSRETAGFSEQMATASLGKKYYEAFPRIFYKDQDALSLVFENKRGITHWYAVMARGLYLLLKRTGIVFSPIGPEVYYHGLRAPYLGRIADIEAGVAKVNPDLLSEFRETLART